jgi:(p)ppGpp synthase/HD superfamily hydrolase
MNNRTRLVDAFELAEWLHQDQFRKRGVDETDALQIPYLTHLSEVMALVILGGGDEDQQIAALLHDAIEDQSVAPDGSDTAELILEKFGKTVSDYVWVCTDGVPGQARGSGNWKERKEVHIGHLDEIADGNPKVLTVSIADKLSNAQAIVSDVSQHGEIVWKRFNAEPKEILWYYQSMLSLFEGHLESSNGLLHRYRRAVGQMSELVP